MRIKGEARQIEKNFLSSDFQCSKVFEKKMSPGLRNALPNMACDYYLSTNPGTYWSCLAFWFCHIFQCIRRSGQSKLIVLYFVLYVLTFLNEQLNKTNSYPTKNSLTDSSICEMSSRFVCSQNPEHISRSRNLTNKIIWMKWEFLQTTKLLTIGAQESALILHFLYFWFLMDRLLWPMCKTRNYCNCVCRKSGTWQIKHSSRQSGCKVVSRSIALCPSLLLRSSSLWLN